MPFASQQQRAFMYSQHPEIARRWRKESGPQKGLPKRSHPRGHGRGRRDARQKLIEQFLAKQKR